MSTSMEVRAASISPKRPSLLVIDDDVLQAMILREIANKMSFDTACAGSFEEAVELLGQSDYACITLDISLGRRSGIDLLHLLKEINCTVPIAIISGEERNVIAKAMMVGKAAKLTMLEPMSKPVNLTQVTNLLTQVRELSKADKALTLARWSSDAADRATWI